MEYVVNMNETPVIFPKLTWIVMQSGIDVKIVGKREADTRLASVLFTAAFNQEQDKLADCMYYDTSIKEWTAITLTAVDKLVLHNKGKEVLRVGGQLSAVGKPTFLTVVKNFITQFSSASLMLQS